MPLQIQRTPGGRLMGRSDGGEAVFLLHQSRRTVNNREVLIRHYLIPGGDRPMAIYAIKNISLSMLNAVDPATDPTHFGLIRNTGGRSKPAVFQGVVFMVFRDIASNICHLVDAESRILAGSNIFGSGGHMCLGSALDPITLNPIDALCLNNANRDLGWQGPLLTGSYVPLDPSSPRSRTTIFNITQWPTWNQLSQPIPPAILAATKAW